MGSSISYPEVEISPERTYLITGGNTGIGYIAAREIARMGGHVIIACRNMEKAHEAIKRMQEEYESDFKSKQTCTDIDQPKKLNVEKMEVDLASFASTQRFVEAFKAKHCPLHVLVCNAGVSSDSLQLTEDGNEMMFQANFLSHFIITLHLLPILMKSGEDCRIVNVSAFAHRFASFDTENFNGEKEFSPFTMYSNTKLFQIMSMFWFNRHLKDRSVSISSLHPGFVDTAMTRQHKYIQWLVVFSKTTFDGGAATIKAAVDPSLKGERDIYRYQCQIQSPSSLARDTEKQEMLMKYTLDVVKKHMPQNLHEYLDF